MAFCTHCGKPVGDSAAFCGSCGARLNAVPAATPAPTPTSAPAPAYDPAAAHAPHTGSLHCPSCKGTHLSPVVESSVNGALTSHRGNLSATRVSNTHRNYWLCNTCGNKFRNIQNLQEEIVYTEKCVTTGIVLTIVSALLFLLMITKGDTIGLLLFFPFVITTGLFALVSFFMIFSYKGKAKKLKQELAYLQYHCFR